MKEPALIDGDAIIKHLNIRKEGPEDSKVLAIDIKLSELACGPGVLVKLLGAETLEGVMQSFWTPDLEPKYLGLEYLPSWADLQHCDIEIEGLRFREASVKKWRVEIGSMAKCKAGCQITISDPPSNSAAILADLVAEVVSVRIIQAQGELDLEMPS